MTFYIILYQTCDFQYLSNQLLYSLFNISKLLTYETKFYDIEHLMINVFLLSCQEAIIHF